MVEQVSIYKNALITQYRVITALMLREVHTIYGDSKLGYLWVLVSVTFGIGVFWGMREFMHASTPNGMNVLIFLVTGFIPWNIISDSLSKCMSAVAGNKALLSFPFVTELDVMVARILVLFFTQFIVGLILIFVTFAYCEEVKVYSYAVFYLALLATFLFSLALGVLFASIEVFLPATSRIVPLIMRVLFFASGVFFSASSFSEEIASILLWNPIFQIIEFLRSSLSYGYPTTYCSWSYVYGVTLVLLAIGLILERYVRARRK